jgi:hypothetical protein
MGLMVMFPKTEVGQFKTPLLRQQSKGSVKLDKDQQKLLDNHLDFHIWRVSFQALSFN